MVIPSILNVLIRFMHCQAVAIIFQSFLQVIDTKWMSRENISEIFIVLFVILLKRTNLFYLFTLCLMLINYKLIQKY